jgi:hypothetical protein
VNKFNSKLEMLEFVENKLIEQGRRSLDASNMFCAYRGTAGAKCAAGHLIDDEHYHPTLERQTSDSYPVIQALVKSGIPEEWHSLVDKMQCMHDSNRADNWENLFSVLRRDDC